jgi:hypothetical protein
MMLAYRMSKHMVLTDGHGEYVLPKSMISSLVIPTMEMSKYNAVNVMMPRISGGMPR